MKGRTIKRHLRESFKSVGRNRWMTFASISAVTVTLLLVGVFLVLMMNLNKIANNLEEDVEIKIIVDLAADEEAIAKLEEKLKANPSLTDIRFSSNEEELEIMIKGYGEELGLYKQSNPLRHVFYVRAIDPQETVKVAKEIGTYEYAFEVIYGEGKVEKLFNILNTGRNIGIVLIVALLFTAMFLISNTIRVTIVARRNEIEIMKLVGATNNFVRIPFVLEGIWLGILGALLPMILLTVAYFNLYDYIQPKLEGELFQPLSKTPFIYQLNGLLLFTGIFIGVWGSFMSVRKFLKV
ncbi:permease-like cell division protein FtsX [Sporosarcina pasteurii]|uniref:Cell division protein FtsX n=1 Tax=Sporosarcina pasteurii TaxID=1474 RepID=A0A380BET5_SPOPA|nr:permease-like cell division protein FtsX [Sporosarcina pasteurii]MDS9470342.1 permease-like cell division protein FtsX [Sporosarcina pasteurii]QBQ05946.1 ABC transporter permease [Sporosarcina pasteurii]SUI99841.1 Cell division protein FtsX [Sporosarcina pasteurii]